QAADRAYRDDPGDAERLQGIDIGLNRQLARHQAVATAMARQKRHRGPFDLTNRDYVRRVAERRLDPDLTHIRQPLHRVEAAAADDANARFSHGSSLRFGAP